MYLILQTVLQLAGVWLFHMKMSIYIISLGGRPFHSSVPKEKDDGMGGG
jgi:hypothetical protein